MSVTFSPEHVGTGRFNIVTYREDVGDMAPFATFDSYAEAELNYLTTCAAEGIETWDAFIVGESAIASAPEVNMANGNAAEVLLALDLDHADLYGSEAGATFVGRVLVALATNRLDTAYIAAREGNVVYSGREAGYIQSRLEGLLEVGEFAAAHGLGVTWG